MQLSKEVASQFAKVVNVKKDRKTESTMTGTVKMENGSMYVRLDGSNTLTPAVTTVKVEDGNRVTVLIKNHSAMITGNISSPAARNEDLSDVTIDAETIKQMIEQIEILEDHDKTQNDKFEEITNNLTEHSNSIASIENIQTEHTNDIDNLQSATNDLNSKVNSLSVDYVVERGISDIWSYEKWANGKMECWGVYTASDVNASENSLDGLYHSAVISIPFPKEFANRPVVIVDGGDPTRIHFVREFGSTTTDAKFTVVCNSADQNGVEIEVSIHAIGTYSTNQNQT